MSVQPTQHGGPCGTPRVSRHPPPALVECPNNCADHPGGGVTRDLGNAEAVHRYTRLFFAVAGDNVTDLAQGSSFAEKQMASYAQVATSPLVLDPIARELGLPITGVELARSVEATVPVDTVIIEIASPIPARNRPQRSLMRLEPRSPRLQEVSLPTARTGLKLFGPPRWQSLRSPPPLVTRTFRATSGLGS